MRKLYFTLMGILTVLWAVSIVAFPISAILFFLNNL